MRASLFATATTTLQGCLVLSNDFIQRLRASFFFSHQLTIALAPWIKSLRKVWLPRLLIPLMREISPLAYCFGVSPIHAAICRPFLNCFALPTDAITALPTIGPMPGTSSNR